MDRAQSVRTREDGSEPWTTLASNIEYEPLGGPAKTLTFGNGYVLTRGYDFHYRPDTIVTADGSTTIQNLDYGYLLTGEIETITDLLNSARSQTFTLDSLSRLTDAAGEYGTFGYTYDGAYNRQSRTNTTGSGYEETYTYPLDSHRLEAVSSTGVGGNDDSFEYTEL